MACTPNAAAQPRLAELIRPKLEAALRRREAMTQSELPCGFG